MAAFSDGTAWTGWQPGEDGGVWLLTQEEMERDYPEVIERKAERP